MDLSFELKEEKPKKINNSKNVINTNNSKKDKSTNENNNKNKPKNPEQKNIIPPIYKKPKVKAKKNRNEKINEFNTPEYNQGQNNISISLSNQTHKNNNNIQINNIDNKRRNIRR